jgi:hypothetical protein
MSRLSVETENAAGENEDALIKNLTEQKVGAGEAHQR